jgi:spermidine synthase
MPTSVKNIDQGAKKSAQSQILKVCIFATGLSGIVAEYVMATLASYLLGNAVLQWTLTVSLMLFAMGVGSRISKYIKTDLLDIFILIEFILSILCAVSALMAYLFSTLTFHIAIIIYLISMAIGFLIGLEIPIVTRLNNYFEDLRINISSVMEKDYYGALLGGVLFVFVALPYLGLTYTPIVLGSVNFLIATLLFFKFHKLLAKKILLNIGVIIVPLIISILIFLAEPIVLYGEQHKYRDRIIYQEQSKYQRIVVTEWNDHYWLYLNGNEQFSSYDEERYHEPLVHPALQIAANRENILILGGGDGLAAREILKYPDVKNLTLVDIDPAMTELGKTYPVFVNLNNSSLLNPKVEIINQDAYKYLLENNQIFDIILIDLPDPKTIDIARLYSVQFFKLVNRHLGMGGIIVTQATSPFFARKAFLCILKTVQSANFTATSYHNHIPTLGEWGWVMGIKDSRISAENLKAMLSQITFNNISTRFISQEAMLSMINFGKGIFDEFPEIEINDELDLNLYHYYRQGTWGIY